MDKWLETGTVNKVHLLTCQEPTRPSTSQHIAVGLILVSDSVSKHHKSSK